MFSRLIRSAVDIIYPKICLGCKNKLPLSSIDNVLCLDCWGSIEKNKPPFCHCCGRHLKKTNFSKGLCPDCIKNKCYFDRAFSPCVYRGLIKDLIHEFKYRQKAFLGRTLSRLLIEFIKEYNLPIDYIDYIIPIPLHKSRLREREFNQAEILSNAVAQEFNKEILNDVLIRSRLTKTQTELESVQRFENLRGSFSIVNNCALKRKNVLLIDDVITTGATCSEAALALKNSQVNIVFALSLAN